VRRSMTLREKRSAYVSMRRVGEIFSSSRVAPQILNRICPGKSKYAGAVFSCPDKKRKET